MRKGQAVLEYVLTFTMLLGVAGLVWIFLRAVDRRADRTRALVVQDCP